MRFIVKKKTFDCAREAGAIFLTQVKNNQKHLLNQIQHGCRIQKSLEHFDEGWDKGHGRLEHRVYESFSALPMLKKWQDDWSEIRRIIRVTRYRERLGSKQSPKEEVSYYVINRDLPLESAQKAIRQHWHIENQLHYVKDVAFCEDKSQRSVNPGILSTCIDIALNRLRKNKCKNIKKTIYETSLDFKGLINNEILIN